ncbi:MarR family winged helix-turn-helix transcriptional regulator [Streptomyces sp. TRM64462]|uniref:MarR family winged helix-turn-helix transcriptional regulator n=1 Tax=Streptomyces sp. TRM64462 TaxID=2741726 RepID=UPI002815978A|nr:MarR family winged helix-turn-helix transcriptional regulator [Streptomyces sp. TRM64462]
MDRADADRPDAAAVRHQAASSARSCSEVTPSAARGGPISLALARVARLHRIAAGRFLKAAGLYPGQELVMMYLWDSGPVRQSELIKALEVDPSTVTKMLQRLEHGGYVRRSPDPADRRAVLVEATPGSCELHNAVASAWTDLEEHTLAGLGPEERAELAALLGKVEDGLCGLAQDCPAGGAEAAEECAPQEECPASPESTPSARSTSAAEL